MQPHPTEQELIRQAQQGDEEALTLLYETHVDAIFEYIRYRVDSRSTAEDLTSDVFLRMVRSLATYQHQGIPFRVWLFRIAANIVIDHYRQQKTTTYAPLLDDQASDDTDPFDRLSLSEDQLRLRLAIRKLPQMYQDLLLLRFVENLPHAEIAKVMNKSVEALRAMQHRALKALGEQFNQLDSQFSSPQEGK